MTNTTNNAAAALAATMEASREGWRIAPTGDGRRAIIAALRVALAEAGWEGLGLKGPRYGETEPPLPAALVAAAGEALVATGNFHTADLAGGVLGGERVGAALRAWR